MLLQHLHGKNQQVQIVFSSHTEPFHSGLMQQLLSMTTIASGTQLYLHLMLSHPQLRNLQQVFSTSVISTITEVLEEA